MNLNPPSGTRITWQDPVATAAALPTLGNTVGDARVAKDTSTIYVWNGTAWVASAGGGGPPTGAAGGDLAATYPNPNVAAIHETSGPTKLTIGAVADGQVLTRSGTALIGTTPAGVTPATGIRANKKMAAQTTAANGDLACATAVATTPASSSAAGGYVAVLVNGVAYSVGDASKSGVACYFSGDGGTTARAMKSIVAGDLLYWQGTIAGFQLAAAADVIDFDFEVST